MNKVELTKAIIEKRDELISQKKKLQDSNTLYKREGIVTFDPWEYKELKEIISILELELKGLEDKRNLL